MRFSMTKLMLWWITIVGFISLETGILHAQHKILFLHLRMQDDTIKLVGSNVRSGVLKQARDLDKIGRMEYEFRSSAGLLLWKGIMDDPTIRRYEFEDPMKPGQLTVKQVRLKDVEFTLRAPFKEEMHRVEFYRTTLARSSSGMLDNVRTFIGTIEVMPERGKQ